MLLSGSDAGSRMPKMIGDFFYEITLPFSVLSPCFFAVYMDDLLQSLRDLGVGCHIGDIFVGAAGFADDIILMAPSRSAMKNMLEVCERYAAENNLLFSTDENPEKSKTKCLYMCGKLLSS